MPPGHSMGGRVALEVMPLVPHQEMQQAIAGSRFTIVPDCGHMSAVEQPEVASRALGGWLFTLV